MAKQCMFNCIHYIRDEVPEVLDDHLQILNLHQGQGNETVSLGVSHRTIVLARRHDSASANQVGTLGERRRISH